MVFSLRNVNGVCVLLSIPEKVDSMAANYVIMDPQAETNLYPGVVYGFTALSGVNPPTVHCARSHDSATFANYSHGDCYIVVGGSSISVDEFSVRSEDELVEIVSSFVGTREFVSRLRSFYRRISKIDQEKPFLYEVLKRADLVDVVIYARQEIRDVFASLVGVDDLSQDAKNTITHLLGTSEYTSPPNLCFKPQDFEIVGKRLASGTVNFPSKGFGLQHAVYQVMAALDPTLKATYGYWEIANGEFKRHSYKEAVSIAASSLNGAV